MHHYRKKLPPLDPLVAFEAAARHLSFTRAASELNLSQAAVSQQIRSLEEYLGISLFHRSHRSVALTREGRDYQHTVASTLNQLANATVELRVTDPDNTLTVAVDQSIASLWLIPRLRRFQAAYPKVKLRLIASDNVEECLNNKVHIAIIYGDGKFRGYDALQIFDEAIFPVCSPEFLEEHGPINSTADLVKHNLIELEDHNWNWMNWRRWLSEQGVDLPVENRHMYVNSYPVVIDAARAGHGVALGWRNLVCDEFSHGKLVNPTGDLYKSDHGYYMLLHSGRPLSEDGRKFVDWISTNNHCEHCRFSETCGLVGMAG